jgi:hypothetical protein
MTTNLLNINKLNPSPPFFVKKGGAVTGFIDNYLSPKSLVLWGTNLSSTVGIRLTINQLAMIYLPRYQYGVIVGLMLSDGWITFGSKNSKMHD